MRGVLKSAVDFARGTWLAIGFAISAAADPLEYVKRLGLVRQETQWLIGSTGMRALFLAFAVLILFVWFHRNRVKFEEPAHPKPDMPFHEAFQYIAQHSEWASRLPPEEDENWISLVEQELFTAIANGELLAFGRLSLSAQSASIAFSIIPAGVFSHAHFDTFSMANSTPPHRISENGNPSHRWARPKLNQRQVKVRWPRRSLWAWWSGRSPIDRINKGARAQGSHTYAEIFAEQNKRYDRDPTLLNIQLLEGEYN